MYAEMIHHGRSLFQLDDKALEELQRDMDLTHTDMNHIELLINTIKNEEKAKARRR